MRNRSFYRRTFCTVGRKHRVSWLSTSCTSRLTGLEPAPRWSQRTT